VTVRIVPTSSLAGHTLQRETFRTSRLLDFCNEPELVKQIGHPSDRWPLVVLKELTDNALDEAEEAGTAPEIHVEVSGNAALDLGRRCGRKRPSQSLSSGFLRGGARITSTYSFAYGRNCNHPYIAIDLHWRIQSCRPASYTLKKFVSTRALHQKRLKQGRVIRTGMSLGLSLARNRQNLNLLHRLSKRKANQIAVVRIRVGMAPQNVARSIENGLAVVDFNAFRMRRVVSQNQVGAGVDQIVRKLAIVRVNLILSVGRPVYRDQDVIDLWA
jgi:hypothetical protein